MTPVVSTAWAASKILLATPGLLLGLSVRIATPGTYYLIVLDAVAVPADSTDVTTVTYKRITIDPLTTTGANELVTYTFAEPGYPSGSGVRLTAGCVVILSSQPPTSLAGVISGMWVSLAEFG